MNVFDHESSSATHMIPNLAVKSSHTNPTNHGNACLEANTRLSVQTSQTNSVCEGTVARVDGAIYRGEPWRNVPCHARELSFRLAASYGFRGQYAAHRGIPSRR